MTFSIVQVVAIAILGCSSFGSGWMLRRIHAKRREAQLQGELHTASSTIPSLQTNLKNRDQRIATLFGELTEWKAKVPSLEAAMKRKDEAAHALEQTLGSVQARLTEAQAVIGARPAADAQAAEIEALKNALRAAETRGSELAAAVARRDLRLAAASGGTGHATEVADEAAIGALEAELAARDRTIEDLNTRALADAQARRDVDATLQVRGAELERIRSDLGKWQARAQKLVATMKTRDAAIAAHDAVVKGRDALIAERDSVIAERNGVIAQRDAAIATYDSRIATRDAALVESDAEIKRLAEQLSAMTARSAAFADALEARKREVADAVETHKRDVFDLTQRNAALSRELETAARQDAAKLETALRIGREELDEHRAAMGQLAAERDAHAQRADATATELTTLNSRHAELIATEAAAAQRHAQTEADTRAQNLALSQRVTSLEAQLKAAQTQRDVVERERANLEQDAARRADQLAAAQLTLSDLRGALESVEARLAESESDAKEEAATYEARLQRATSQYDELERAAADERRAAIDARHANAALQQANSELDDRVVAGDAKCTELERRADALRCELEDQRQQLEAVHSELVEERHAKLQIAQERDERNVELAALQDEVRGLRNTGPALETLLQQRDVTLTERTQRIDALETQLAVFTTQNETLQSTLRQRGERIAALERKLTEPASESVPVATERAPDDADQRIAEQTRKNAELTRLVEVRERELTQAAKTNDLNEKSIRVLKQQLDDARASQERLATQVRELKAAAQRVPEPAATTKLEMVKPSGLFELPPEHVDELQQIHGIGAGFERGLNKLGIYQFSQLAGVSAEEIAWIEAHLPTFHGRIERDDWPGQAAALLAASEHDEWSLRAQLDAGVSAPRVN